MSVPDDWPIALDEDAVLKGLGYDPAEIRARAPAFVEAASHALELGLPLLRPGLATAERRITGREGDVVRLAGGGVLAGRLIASRLAEAVEAAVIVCTIGPALERRASEAIVGDVVLGFALDALGTAAVEALATAACRSIEGRAAARDWGWTSPVSPGMVGWPLADGQRQLVSLVDLTSLGVTVTGSSQFVPIKSLSMAVGLGPALGRDAGSCEACGLGKRCRYRALACGSAAGAARGDMKEPEWTCDRN